MVAENKAIDKEESAEPRHDIIEKLYDKVYTIFHNEAFELKATHQEVMIMMMYLNDKVNEDRLRILHQILHAEGIKKEPPTTSMYS